MKCDILCCGFYHEIPRRGIVRIRTSNLAFRATDLLEEPPELETRPGIYSALEGFECDDSIIDSVIQDFARIRAIFGKWRADFDNGEVDESTHPLYADPLYQELYSRLDEFFSRLNNPVIVVNGLMSIQSGKWVFEIVDDRVE